MGDVDGDGITDLAVGGPDSDLTFSSGGSVTLLSGATGSVIWARGGFAAGDSFGFAVAGLGGDVNGDGVNDLVTGARFSDIAGPNFGAALLLSGVDGSVIRQHLGSDSNSRFGETLGPAGDVNNDGIPDAIIGARLDESGGSNTGSARVFSGADGSLLHELFGDSPSDNFGLTVGTACLLYTSPSPRDQRGSRMPSSA